MSRNNGKFNPKGLNAILAKLEEMKRLRTYVGVPASTNAARGDGLSNATIAAAHEFGVSGHIPERSFLRSTVEENKQKAATFLSNEISRVLIDGGDIKQPFDLLGRNMSGEVVRKIERGINPPLSDATKAARNRKNKSAKAKAGRSMTPLHDSGQLVQSITWEVRND